MRVNLEPNTSDETFKQKTYYFSFLMKDYFMEFRDLQ